MFKVNEEVQIQSGNYKGVWAKILQIQPGKVYKLELPETKKVVYYSEMSLKAKENIPLNFERTENGMQTIGSGSSSSDGMAAGNILPKMQTLLSRNMC